MGNTAKSLGIDKLDVDERLKLIGEIWDSVSEEAGDLSLSRKMKDELDKLTAFALVSRGQLAAVLSVKWLDEFMQES